MKQLIIVLILCLASLVEVLGQTGTQISGVIKNASGTGVADVSVFVSKVEYKYSVFASCFSHEDGAFAVSINTAADSVCIHVSGLNITPTSVICKNVSHYREIVVEEKVQEIAEVIVCAPKIYSKGDTISYHVAAFQSKNDISIGQVLKRLPGITISDVGQISYKGQPIKNFYIEGLDLMKGRYGIATNNIDPNSISTIEVLENHQDIKVLKDLKPEERASINLKLKGGVKGVFNLIATLGGGYEEEALWNHELISTYFKKNNQLLVTCKGNNSGHDLEQELRSFDDSDYSKTAAVSNISMPSAPGINKKYYYLNQSHTATYNQVFKVGGNGILGINAAFLHDRDERNNHSVANTLLPDGSENILNERFSGSILKNMASGNLTYSQNTDEIYIKEQIKADWFSTEGKSQIFAGEEISQNNKVGNYRLHNLLHLTRRTGNDKGIEFLSKVNLEKRPHHLFVFPNLFPDVITSDMIFQTAERKNLSAENRLDFLSAVVWGNLQIHPTLFFDYSYNGLTSALETNCNHLGLTSIHTGAGMIASYRRQRFYASLYISGNYRYFNLTNRTTKADTDKHRFVVEPRLTLRYDMDGRNELRFSGNLSHSNPAIENLYNQYILTTYRQLSVYENSDLYQAQVQNYRLSYDYKNIVSMLFLGADISWDHHRPDVLYGSSYDGIAEKIISRPTEETADILSAKLRGSKGFDWKHMKIGWECGYRYFDSPLLLQHEIIRYKGHVINAKLDLTLNPFRWMAFSYDGTFYRSQTKMQGGGDMPVLKTWSNQALIEIYLPHEITLGAGVSHDYNNLNQTDKSFLLGEVNIKYTYKRWSFTLSCDNLFNRKTYVYSTSRELTEHTSVYHIRPRSILLKVRYRIF